MRRVIPTALCATLAVSVMIDARGEPQPFVVDAPARPADALRLAFRNAALPLPDSLSCRGVVTGVARPTLGDWLALLFSELPPAAGVSGVEAGCEGPEEKLACAVHVRRASGEEVWRWGVRFVADGRSGVIDPGSILCDQAG